MLLGDDSDSEIELTLNESYAGRYNTWRQKEELQKLKDRYGEEAVMKGTSGPSCDSSSSEDEDENAEQLTQQLEKDFFKTLSCVKQKDPRIYDKNACFFNAPATVSKQTRSVTKEEKPLFLRDYERKLIVEREGKLSEDEEEGDYTGRPASPTIAEEEKIIKNNFKKALIESDDENENGDKTWGGIFKKRIKTKEEEEKEEEDYREWLKGQKEEITDKNTESDLKFLHDYWNDPDLNDNEKFLKDYILNKRFLEEGDDEDYIPTYEEIVHDSDENLSEDEKAIEKQEEFEHKFNFRFEEPDKEFIKRYPRTMENSLRKRDDKRKIKRQEVRERKAAEEAKKREELKKLKSLKRKEIMGKIERLKEITGNEEVGFKEEDLEGDFDPDAYDKRMSQLFDQEFYKEEEIAKPECPDLEEELEIENWNSWNGEDHPQNDQDDYQQDQEHEPHCEDPDFNMDCDYDPAKQLQKQLIESSKRKKKGRKWKSAFAEALSRKKPVFDASNHTFEEYLDEYYKLDFEDLIGDLPCRFKYRKVVPNNFGLSVEEILTAEDKELNKWCSLKKAVQHRPVHIEKYDVHAYQKKARNEQLKKKILQSVYAEKLEQVGSEKQKKKKSKKNKCSPEEETQYTCSEQVEEKVDEVRSKQRNRKNEVHELNNSSGVAKKRKISENGYEEESNIESDKDPKKRKNKKLMLLSSSDVCTSEKESMRSEHPKQEAHHLSTLSDFHHDQHSTKANKKKKKKRKTSKNVSTPICDVGRIGNNLSKKHKRKLHAADQGDMSLSDARLRAYGINPKKYKNKLKYGYR